MILALLLAASAPTSAQIASGWRSYANARFGYQICFPGDLHEYGREPDNGDGRVFRNAGGAELRVWGQWNGEPDTIASAAARERTYLVGDAYRVTYSAKGRDWFVLSARAGDRIVYERGWLNRDRFVTFTLSYPAASAARWNAAVAKIAACVRNTPEGPLK